jgi:hypothetical protein
VHRESSYVGSIYSDSSSLFDDLITPANKLEYARFTLNQEPAMRFKQIPTPQQFQLDDTQYKDSDRPLSAHIIRQVSSRYYELPKTRRSHVVGASRFWYRKPSGIPLPPCQQQSNRCHIRLLRRPSSDNRNSWVYPSPVRVNNRQPGYMAATIASRNKSNIRTANVSPKQASQPNRADIPHFQHPWVPSKRSRLVALTEPKRLSPSGAYRF